MYRGGRRRRLAVLHSSNLPLAAPAWPCADAALESEYKAAEAAEAQAHDATFALIRALVWAVVAVKSAALGWAVGLRVAAACVLPALLQLVASAPARGAPPPYQLSAALSLVQAAGEALAAFALLPLLLAQSRPAALSSPLHAYMHPLMGVREAAGGRLLRWRGRGHAGCWRHGRSGAHDRVPRTAPASHRPSTWCL